jgi:hypothetical protein
MSRKKDEHLWVGAVCSENVLLFRAVKYDHIHEKLRIDRILHIQCFLHHFFPGRFPVRECPLGSDENPVVDEHPAKYHLGFEETLAHVDPAVKQYAGTTLKEMVSAAMANGNPMFKFGFVSREHVEACRELWEAFGYRASNEAAGIFKSNGSRLHGHWKHVVFSLSERKWGRPIQSRPNI